MLIAIMLSVIMLNVIMLNAVMLNVIAPNLELNRPFNAKGASMSVADWDLVERQKTYL